MPRDETEWRWESLKDPYVPGYTLKRVVNRRRSKQLVPGWDGYLNVQQDISKERWLYGLSMSRGMGQHIERVKDSGHAATLDEAKAMAERSLILLNQTPVDADAFG